MYIIYIYAYICVCIYRCIYVGMCIYMYVCKLGVAGKYRRFWKLSGSPGLFFYLVNKRLKYFHIETCDISFE